MDVYTEASSTKLGWSTLAKRFEQAQQRTSADPLTALASLAQLEEAVNALIREAVVTATREARATARAEAIRQGKPAKDLRELEGSVQKEIEKAVGLTGDVSARKLVTYADHLRHDDPLWALKHLTEVENGWEIEEKKDGAGGGRAKKIRLGALDRMMQVVVDAALDSGASWSEIALHTGLRDRQAAWRRWTASVRQPPGKRRRSTAVRSLHQMQLLSKG